MKRPSWQQGLVVSGFIAIGKSTVASHRFIDGYKIIDLDSSSFSFLPDGTRNPNWLEQYLRKIEGLIQERSCIVLVSAHADLREALTAAGIYFATVQPSVECKDDYVRRIDKRGNARLTKLVSLNWESFIQDSVRLRGSHAYRLTKEQQYLTTDVLSCLIEAFKA